MVASDYIPEKGDIVWLNFDPQISDQIKNLDWRERDCTFIERAREEELTSVVDNIKLLID